MEQREILNGVIVGEGSGFSPVPFLAPARSSPRAGALGRIGGSGLSGEINHEANCAAAERSLLPPAVLLNG